MPNNSNGPRQFSTARGNFLTVMLDLTKGRARILSNPNAAQEAAEATRRAMEGESKNVTLLASSAK